MMERKVKTVIVGATYYGIGYAYSHPGCLILEASQILGGEFHNNGRSSDIKEISEKETNCELAVTMERHQVLDGGHFDILKAAPALHEFVASKKNIHVLLDVRIIEIKKLLQGFYIDYISNAGIDKIFCDFLLDTTVMRDSYPQGVKCTAKFLNLVTVCNENEFANKIRAGHPDWLVNDGYHPAEKAVKIPIPLDMSVLDAYEAVTEMWKEIFPNREEKILFLPSEFEYVCEEVNASSAPCVWKGQHCGNPLTAFVNGMYARL